MLAEVNVNPRVTGGGAARIMGTIRKCEADVREFERLFNRGDRKAEFSQELSANSAFSAVKEQWVER